ncbi:TIGR03032 family protein [Sphingomonas colocasiae]|uniref:TIGR03032 family protein n=1 Tax=Sphingomonas colocasiae TaxID=1848973 RepID=A0ABS7PXL8_9SPHN|nr:TIGR03032 family protein [Sphingomonas colocasiae]
MLPAPPFVALAATMIAMFAPIPAEAKAPACPGFARGLAFVGDHAVIGLSLPRENRTFAGLPLQDALARRRAEARCGLAIVDLATGDMVQWAHRRRGARALRRRRAARHPQSRRDRFQDRRGAESDLGGGIGGARFRARRAARVCSRRPRLPDRGPIPLRRGPAGAGAGRWRGRWRRRAEHGRWRMYPIRRPRGSVRAGGDRSRGRWRHRGVRPSPEASRSRRGLRRTPPAMCCAAARRGRRTRFRPARARPWGRGRRRQGVVGLSWASSVIWMHHA